MQFSRFLTIPGLFTRQPGVNMKRGKYGCIVLTPGLVPPGCMKSGFTVIPIVIGIQTVCFTRLRSDLVGTGTCHVPGSCEILGFLLQERARPRTG